MGAISLSSVEEQIEEEWEEKRVFLLEIVYTRNKGYRFLESVISYSANALHWSRTRFFLFYAIPSPILHFFPRRQSNWVCLQLSC